MTLHAADREIPLLQVMDLCKSYPIANQGLWQTRHSLYALQRVSLQIASGETVGLIGESGSGKSTLARIVSRLMSADSGQVLLHGREILGLSRREFAPWRRSIQMIFQDPNSSLNPRFTIAQTLAEPLIGFQIGNREEHQRRIKQMLSVVGLDESVLPRYPQQLSGGQKQRVAILGVLLVEPQLIVADEIVSALDLSVQAQILNLWRELQQKFNLATLFISHDLHVVGWIADRILVMYRGRIVEEGTAAEICLHPLHPYTRLLFASATTEEEEIPIHWGGSTAEEAEGGCAFYPRCRERQQRCYLHIPENKHISDSHALRCHL